MSNEVICRYFLRGICRFGDYCRFAHTVPINHNSNNLNDMITDDNSIHAINNTDLFTVNNLNREVLISDRTSTIQNNSNIKDPNSWVMAPEFVPRTRLQHRLYQEKMAAEAAAARSAQEAATTTVAASTIKPTVPSMPFFNLVSDDEDDDMRACSSNSVLESEGGASSLIAASTTATVGDSASTSGSSSNPSYAEVVAGPSGTNNFNNAPPHFDSDLHDFFEGDSDDEGPLVPYIILEKKSDELCPFEGFCVYGKYCVYTHGDLCDFCGRNVLHPNDTEQRKKHIAECVKEHEITMEFSFAVARSKDKTCGICFDVIMDKTGYEQRFGILPNCNHVFCLGCIRKWRQAKQFENKITRSCPECRVPSDYVCPSPFWVDTKEDKEKLLTAYKEALGKKDCKYFKQGKGKCPFGNKCFYKHALPNGQHIDVGLPQKRSKRGDDELLDLFDQVFPQIYLWDFFNQRNLHSESESDLSDIDLLN